MRDASILSHQPGPERRALAIVELGDRPGATLAGTGEIAPIQSRQALQEEGFHQDSGIVESFAKRHGFVRQFTTKAKVSADYMKREITPHYREELRPLGHAFA